MRVKVGLRLILNAKDEVSGESKGQGSGNELGQCLCVCMDPILTQFSLFIHSFHILCIGTSI